jgi:hypothetical protein
MHSLSTHTHTHTVYAHFQECKYCVNQEVAVYDSEIWDFNSYKDIQIHEENLK